MAAIAFLPFANGRFGFWLAAIIGPALLVRFMRTQPLARALAGGVLAMSIAELFWWKGIIAIHGFAFVAASIVFGMVNVLPYVLDRAVARRVHGFANTFTLPVAMIALEMLAARFSPIGSWGSFAYTQAGNLPLLQLVSITGLAGVTFLVLWTAAILNGTTRRGVIAYAVVVMAVLAFGGVRLLRAPREAHLRVAAITPAVPTYTVAAFKADAKRAAAIQQELLDASEREARRGAKVIVWSEGAGLVDARDEAAFLGRAAAVAKRSGAAIALAFLSLRGNAFENKSVLIDEQGRARWTYHKAHPVPGMEDRLRPGDGKLPVADTAFGRVSTAICFDADFPELVRQAGRAGARLLIVPADDWDVIASLHARMVKFRAIEEQLTVVRSTSNGRSVAYDPYGRELASADYFSGARVMTATIPSR
ncbi:MAG TPA: nitrilase-related carbon-nitrogen hydrolase [Thermoanaerobaculia bacterium]|nr:nitrilase-related carbon-nitrogen hydrolase [Thermoanaerobaculia bacterium]